MPYLDDFEEQFGKPAGKTLSRMIRPTVTAPEGKVFVWGDWSNIEARGLPWLADAQHRLDVFRAIDADPANTPDVYLQAVAGMYHHDPMELLARRRAKDKAVDALRQRGKIAELALGFAGGVGALQSMASNYGMLFEEDEAAEIVERWRAANSWATAFWDEVWGAFIKAFSRPDGTMHRAGLVVYQGVLVGNETWVACFLPDNRPLFYRNVRERKHVEYDPFDPTEVISTTMKLSFEGADGVKWLWKGILVENITQAACASILRETLVDLESGDYDALEVVGHTHDEIITLTDDTPDAIARAKDTLRAAMIKRRDWMGNLPVEADITHHAWYSKAIED